MSQALIDLGKHVAQALSGEVTGTELRNGELIVSARASGVVRTLTFLRDDPSCQFTTLVDVTATDQPSREQRFDVVYNLLSIKLNQRCRVKVATDEETPVPSAVGVFSSANWY